MIEDIKKISNIKKDSNPKKRFIKDIIFFVIVTAVAEVSAVLIYFTMPWLVKWTTTTFLFVSSGIILVIAGILTLLVGIAKKNEDIKRKSIALLASGGFIALLFLIK